MIGKLLAVALIALLATPAGAAQDDGIVATLYQTVNVRSGPDTRFEIVGQVSVGDTVQVVGRGDENRWLYVRLADGATGWIPSFLLIFEEDPTVLPVVSATGEGSGGIDAIVTVVAYGQVNVRSGPSITNDVIAQLDVADQAQVLARNSERNDWLYVENAALAGWVAYFTVQVHGDPNTLPVRVPDAASSDDLVAPTALIRTRFNTRLHSEPMLASSVPGIVPFDSPVTPLARNEDGEWLYVGYEALLGWAVTDLFVITPEQVARLALYSPDIDYAERATPNAQTPEATPDLASPTPEVTEAAVG